jgi:hypothetical protein
MNEETTKTTVHWKVKQDTEMYATFQQSQHKKAYKCMQPNKTNRIVVTAVLVTIDKLKSRYA